ncbi:peptide ligase PGM1-related protein [Streptomyces sp. 184]|uniref:preATP grasp domain-containing protein n=1 Tax=Streptomyces sp. 184 TaxID=1827526 RepID=UPI003891C85A
MTSPHHDEPLIIFANFASAIAVDLRERDILRQWSEQAPREIWLARPGDVLVTPVPLSDAFVTYACSLMRIPRTSFDVVTVPDLPGVPMATAIRRSGLTGLLGRFAARHPGTGLLPIALDAPTLALADDLGVSVSPYDRTGPRVSAAALAETSLLNTKAGFRERAGRLGMRLPRARTCRGPELPGAVREVVAAHGRAVVKRDRSAGGHGIRFVSRRDPGVAAEPDDGELWVVEEYVEHTASVSVQYEVGPDGPRMLFHGEMDTHQGSFTGYRSPLVAPADSSVEELGGWALALGRHLAAHGYRGPYGIDAVLTAGGTVYATESNVRRTATTTPHAMFTRLRRAVGRPAPAWMMARRTSAAPHTLPAALERLHATGLAYDAGRGDGVVLYAGHADHAHDWRYALLGADRDHLAELDTRLATAMRFTTPVGV